MENKAPRSMGVHALKPSNRYHRRLSVEVLCWGRQRANYLGRVLVAAERAGWSRECEV